SARWSSTDLDFCPPGRIFSPLRESTPTYAPAERLLRSSERPRSRLKPTRVSPAPGAPAGARCHAMSETDTRPQGPMAAVLDSLPVGLLIASAADGSVQYANWAAAALFEVRPEALLGASWPHAQYVRRPDGSSFPAERL